VPSFDAFVSGLREHGYLVGQNLLIEYRDTDGGEDRLLELATQLTQIPVDVIVGPSAGARVAQRATASIPIVLSVGGDPVGGGLVTSFAHPEGNITGVVGEPAGTLQPKMLELLHQIAPSVARVGVLYEATGVAGPTERVGLTALAAAAEILGLQLHRMSVSNSGEIEEIFDGAAEVPIDGLLMIDMPLLGENRARIADRALRYHLPSVAMFRASAEAGLLLTYGPNLPAIQMRAAYYVDRLLQGAKPADLPIEQPREFDFVINLKTAQALGLTIPQHVLLQATEVIQ
jgi:putative ABC transport system substrate-binding protein